MSLKAKQAPLLLEDIKEPHCKVPWDYHAIVTIPILEPYAEWLVMNCSHNLRTLKLLINCLAQSYIRVKKLEQPY